ncbi:Soluble secretory phospholipase A2 receptor [Capsicum annuum]|nr:Soluble secretory phospholipase A2 receptor [Capsicum annuum]
MSAGTDISSLETRYIYSSQARGVPPNKQVLSALYKAKLKKARHEVSSLVILLDDIKDTDFHPLLDLLTEADISEIDAVDIINRSVCILSWEYLLALVRASSRKLRVVDLQDILFGKEFLQNLAQHGIPCQVLNLRSSHFRKLNMIGNFTRMHSLNLDFSASLTNFREDCFTSMPNLKFLSLCETRIINLWTTTAALAKLPSLVELRFQNFLQDNEVRKHAASDRRTDYWESDRTETSIHDEAPSVSGENIMYRLFNEEDQYMNNTDMDLDVSSETEDSSDDSEVDFSSQDRETSFMELLPDAPPGWEDLVNLQNEVSLGMLEMQDDEEPFFRLSNTRLPHITPKKCISHNPSPICFEKFYREYMIASLPNLKILDNLPIRKVDREKAELIFSQKFEHLPYKRKYKESIVSILQKRETRANHTRGFSPRRKSQYFYSRSLSSAKVGSVAWPAFRPLSVMRTRTRDDRRSYRPRQFEYHPSDASLMVFGTLDGEVIVINHESEKIVSYIPSLGAMNSVLGLCWLKNYPSKVIAGSDNGSLRLYDIRLMSTTATGSHQSAGSIMFDDFDHLTSVHVNSTDELFLASGYSKHVALYDISSGRRLQVFDDMHREHINVVKFAHHSPSIFATSSFDRDVKLWDLRQKPNQPCYTALSSRGNVMVCFSPDDQYLLVSAVDNEVKQLLAVDGRLHLDFSITSTGSSQNYTRSYYMNGRDYVISGSCDEHVVRICCAQTGRRLRDVSLEGKGSGASMFVQSLRGDPFRDFTMSVLAAYIRPSSNSEIVKVNLLASSDQDKGHSYTRHSHPLCSSGG